MKWIMASVAALVAAVLSVGAAARSSGTMGKGDKMDKMEMKDTTYTGCIEAGSAPGIFTLTHLAADDHIGKDAMKKETMGKDTMGKGGSAFTVKSLKMVAAAWVKSRRWGHRHRLLHRPRHRHPLQRPTWLSLRATPSSSRSFNGSSCGWRSLLEPQLEAARHNDVVDRRGRRRNREAAGTCV